jgi:predicted O-linked N-acetylglucosamine transferase (SPINDLY family)
LTDSLIDQARAALNAGEGERGEALARRAAEEGQAGAHTLLARIFRARGELDEAMVHAEAALDHDPADAVAWAYCGSVLLARGDTDDAVQSYERAVSLRPGNAILLNEYGNALAVAGRFADAETTLRQAIGAQPDIPEIHNNLGNVLRSLRRFEDAEAAYGAAIDLRPDYAEALGNRGVLYLGRGAAALAIAAFEQGLALQPENALMRTHLGAAYAGAGRLEDAVAAHRAALDHDPDLIAAHNNLAIALKDQGMLHQARAAYSAAMALAPGDAGIRSNYLMCLSYDPDIDGPTLLGEHRRWAAAHERPVPSETVVDAEPDRVIRIGYVSADFWTHSVAYFIEPVLARHDRSAFHVTCYADVEAPDETTARLRGLSDRWRDTRGVDDAALYDQIEADDIDILVDLAGHTGGNRLPLFGRRAAPLQLTWIGYPATTGLEQMDYRITDAWADPPGTTDAFHSETLLRLPHGFLCYRPPDDAPLLDSRAGERPPTFGSFNNLSKLGDGVIALWARILGEMPEARLLLKSRQLADTGVRDRILAAFGAHGVDGARLQFRPRVPSQAAHLGLYDEVDVALDTFPYNGTTTTCEALWMGVPVVALAGRLHAGRVGVSLLEQTGCGDWIAETPDDYVAIACGLAKDPPDREALRRRIVESSLTDARGFTRDLETALRSIWRRWCEGQV